MNTHTPDEQTYSSPPLRPFFGEVHEIYVSMAWSDVLSCGASLTMVWGVWRKGWALLCRILKPTALLTITSTVAVFLARRAREDGFTAFCRSSSRILWPHELSSAICNFHPQAFVKHILGGARKSIGHFWRTMPRRPGLETRAGWDRFAVPVGAHGDGVAVSNTRGAGSKSVDTLSWTSLLSSSPTRFSSYLIFFCFSQVAKKTGVGANWKEVWKKLARSFQILYSGVWPPTTMDGGPEARMGTPLARGFWGVVYINKGDLEWLAGHFQVAHPSSRFPCALCQCSNLGHGRDEFPWTDANDNPPWEPTCWTDEASM